MLKYLVVGGALFWLVFVYGTPHQTAHPAVESTPKPPFSGLLSSNSLQPKFWQAQAKQDTKLWQQTLAWCQHEYNHRHQPTISQGICTMVLSAKSELDFSHV